MPKKIDHDKRKIQIAEATWKVIADEGIENATVRNIAKTADMSVGSLRHYFSTQSELLLFSMELVSGRVKQRIETKKFEGSPFEIFTKVICELLPVDEERRLEMEVWLAFSAKTLVDADLKVLSKQVYNEMHQGLENIIYTLHSLNLAKENLDKDIEVDRLHALVDGLALHNLLHSEDFTHDKMVQTLKYHLLSICKEEIIRSADHD